MNRLNLNVSRNFGDIITATFVFLRQEFKGIIKNFCILVLPLLLLDVIVKTMLLEYALGDFDMYRLDMEEYMSNVLPSYLVSIIVYTWIMLFVLSYMKIYNEKYLTNYTTPITYKEIWGNMIKHVGPLILWMFLYLIIVVIGTMCLIVPGVWLGILFIFTPCLLIIKNKPFGEAAFNTSFISGEWWSTFGIVVVIGLVVMVISWIFSIPVGAYALMEGVTDIGDNTLVLAILQAISVLGGNFLQIVGVVAIGMQFFSIQEKMEHQMLYRKIDNLGSSTTNIVNEEKY